eukprot:15155-Heterococcus_DN1.PRE.3
MTASRQLVHSAVAAGACALTLRSASSSCAAVATSAVRGSSTLAINCTAPAASSLWWCRAS